MAEWSLVYEDYDPEQQGLREALTTLGNGYFCSRGAFPWAGPDDVNLSKIFGFIAVTLAAVNIFGGFAVTQRMLQMFKKKER